MKIMSYNIRYAGDSDSAHSWSDRKYPLTKQVAFFEPDILCVQEGYTEQLEFMENFLEKYNYSGKGRGEKEQGMQNAIFFKIEKLKLLKTDTFWLSETPDKPSKGWDGEFERTCSYALLENKDSGRKFWIFNTHFDHKGEKATVESAKLILKKIEELNNDNLPVLLTGDLNQEPETECVQIFSEKLKDSKSVSDLVYGPQGTFSGFSVGERINRRVDYVFTDKRIKVLKYAAINNPDGLNYPSDHLPVFVKVSF